MNAVTPPSGGEKSNVGNELRRMGEKPAAEDFKPVQIVHGRLLLLPQEASTTARQPQRMIFGVRLKYGPAKSVISAEEVHAFAQDVADGKDPLAGDFKHFFAPSPYDIGVASQCWIVLELEKEWTNWQFETGAFAVTTKKDYQSDNHTLRCAYPRKHPNGSDKPADAAIPADGCRVAYFGVAKRGYPESQFINIHTEFLQEAPSGTEQHRLRVIFDPDVPNTGPDAIPP